MKSAVMTAFALAVILLTGCTAKTHYYWGEYEPLIYQSYVEPGSADPQTQIQKLTTDIQKASDAGKPTPPGVHAHLGYMFFLDNNPAQAEAALIEEKTLYPEATVFVDGLLQRLRGEK